MQKGGRVALECFTSRVVHVCLLPGKSVVGEVDVPLGAVRLDRWLMGQ